MSSFILFLFKRQGNPQKCSPLLKYNSYGQQQNPGEHIKSEMQTKTSIDENIFPSSFLARVMM